MADVLFTQAHKPSAKASETASRFKSCGIFSSRQWPVRCSPFNAGRLWSCWSWKSRQTPAQIISSEEAPVQHYSPWQEGSRDSLLEGLAGKVCNEMILLSLYQQPPFVTYIQGPAPYSPHACQSFGKKKNQKTPQ